VKLGRDPRAYGGPQLFATDVHANYSGFNISVAQYKEQ